jgi:hypothetical protein
MRRVLVGTRPTDEVRGWFLDRAALGGPARPAAAPGVQRPHLPRHLPIALAEASGSFVWDVDGNVFIDFLTGAGVLSLGHSHPELVRVAARQLERHANGLDFPTPVKDEFVDAQLSSCGPPAGPAPTCGRPASTSAPPTSAPWPAPGPPLGFASLGRRW